MSAEIDKFSKNYGFYRPCFCHILGILSTEALIQGTLTIHGQVLEMIIFGVLVINIEIYMKLLDEFQVSKSKSIFFISIY